MGRNAKKAGLAPTAKKTDVFFLNVVNKKFGQVSILLSHHLWTDLVLILVVKLNGIFWL